jgi:hypothetical protein
MSPPGPFSPERGGLLDWYFDGAAPMVLLGLVTVL